jgi:hypothetical protein
MCGLEGGYHLYHEDGSDMFFRNVGNHIKGVITKKATIDIFTAVRTSNFIKHGINGNTFRMSVGRPEDMDHCGNICVDDRVKLISKRILKEQCVRFWT